VNGQLDRETARIYRGGKVEREDVRLSSRPVSWSSFDTHEIERTLLAAIVGPGNIVAAAHCREFGNADCKLHIARAVIARPRVRLCEREDLFTWGTSIDRSQAMTAGLMEAIERYSTEAYAIDDFPLRPARCLNHPVVDPVRIAGFGKGDVEWQEIAFDEPRRWFPLLRLGDSRPFFAPLELVCFPADSKELGYKPFDGATSSGTAAHFLFSRAVATACHELVERDAFLIAWLRQASPPQIPLESLPDDIRRETAWMLELGYTVRLVDLSTDLAPVIAALASRDTGYMHGIGAASHDDPAFACRKAIREAAVPLCLSTRAPRPADEVLKLIDLPADHLELYAAGAFDDLLMRLFGSGTTKSLGDVRRFAGDIVHRLQGAGYEIYIANLANRRVEQILPSIHVVRAIAPGLVPIQFGAAWPRTGSARIQRIPEEFGWPTSKKDPGDYCRFPHPFP